MTRKDLRCRLTGILLVGVGAASGFATYRMPLGPLRQLGDAANFAIALTGFALACLGTLLLFRGSRMRELWLETCKQSPRDRAASAKQARSNLSAAPRSDPFLYNAAFSGCGRMAIATYLLLRAQQQASMQRAEPRPRCRPQRRAGTNALQYQREKC